MTVQVLSVGACYQWIVIDDVWCMVIVCSFIMKKY